MSAYINMEEMRRDVVHAIANQAQRQEIAAGRPDCSGYESYSKIKDRLEKLAEAVKPLDKSLKEYWKNVSDGDEDLQGSYLREMETETTAAAQAMVLLAATVTRAMWALHPSAERKVGQMSFDELLGEDEGEPEFEDLDETAMPEVDESTGEILDADEDLAPAEEVLGSEE